jgi:hypothetical protein
VTHRSLADVARNTDGGQSRAERRAEGMHC